MAVAGQAEAQGQAGCAATPWQPHNDAPHKVCKLLSLSLRVLQKGVGPGREYSCLPGHNGSREFVCQAPRTAGSWQEHGARSTAYYGNPSKVTSQSGSAYGNSFV